MLKKNPVILQHEYSPNYFMIMVLLRGLSKGVCVWDGQVIILINEFGNSVMTNPELGKLSCMSWIYSS